MATKRDLAIRLLQNLGVVGDGQTPDAADIQIAEQKLDSVHAQLLALRKLRWTWNDVPVYAEEPYVMMGAFLAALPFSKPADINGYRIGLAMLNAANTAPATDAPAGGEYF